MSFTAEEIASQPKLWPEAVAVGRKHSAVLPPPGTSVAVIGCGTSHHIGRAWALAREIRGFGRTDSFPASEFRSSNYDFVICISRSGTTSEVLWAVEKLPPGIRTLGITADGDSSLAEMVDHTAVLDFADERSLLQTRWASCVLAMLRAHIGDPILELTDAGREAVAATLPIDPNDFTRFVFVGRGWATPIADEAALKLREGAGAWTESYASMEYRHGPLSVTDVPTLLWSLGELGDALRADVERSGAVVVESGRDPMVELICIQRAVVDLAEGRGLNPDTPRHLTRSVVLT